MKRIVGLWVHLLILVTPAFSQVDTSYIYNTAMPYGTLDLRIAKSDTRYYYLQEDVTFSFRESAPGVKTNTFRDMTSWNSDPYRQGNLREKNGTQDIFVMNYRLLFPQNYNPAYDPGYPIIIMLHGYGERGNCWNNNCYWSTTGWNPNTNSPAAPTSETHNLLNNDHNLLHGGLKHLDAVKLAGNRLPNDPTMPDRAFPGFVLFPQVLNGWQSAARVEDAIKLLRLIIKKYNIDENRVYIHALSNGGGGLYQAVKRAPWLFAAALPMSAVSNGGIFNEGLAQEVAKIPFWIFQGGKDNNPTPSRTYNTVKGLREAGASVRYYLYPHLGHGTWNSAYNEPDFFSWILAKRKYNPHVYYGNPVICNTNGMGVRISFANGYHAYQWEHDGTVITGANQSQYIANTPGTYRGRFSRVPNPTENDWEPWSDEIVVTEISPAKPTVTALGTTHLRGPGLLSTIPNNTVQLKSDQQAELYTWFKNGVQVDFPGTDVNDTLRTASFTSAGTGANGVYTLKTSYSYCPSPSSDPVYLFFNNSAPQNMTFNATTADFKGVPMNSGVFLTWNDLVSSESGYEIWRRKVGDPEFKFAGKAPKNSISFFDGPLQPNSSFEYKIRAVGNAGVSNYVPSNDLAINLVVNTPGDLEKPLPPQDLKMTLNTIDSFTLSWKAPADNTGIQYYSITYGNTTVNTTSAENFFTISNLPANTTYPVTVKAVDYAGNVSEASNQIIGSTYVLGLFYKHSTGGWEDLDDTTLVETWLNPEFTGTVSNFTLAPRTQEDFFNFQFTGYFDAPADGPYIFRLTSNDGSRLIVDDSLAIENDGVHGNVTKFSDTLMLTKGPHHLELQYFDYAGSQTLTLQYKGPDLTVGYKNVPDTLLRSGKFIAPQAPAIPTGLTAAAAGLDRVDVTWATAGNAVEIYRGLSAEGLFNIVGTNTSGSFIDSVMINPGTQYFYKARSVSTGAMSDFTAVVSATTLVDNIAPSVPSNITLSNKSHTNAALTWTPSTDNAGVAHYEIYVNGILSGSSEIPAYMVSNLDPGANYTITVVAVDASNNKSTASAGLAVTTNPAATYYSLATGNLNALSTWKQFANGTGNSPLDFTENGLVFVIANRTSTGLGGPWDVSGSASKVIVPAGVTLNIDNVLNGKLEIEGNAVVNLNHETLPTFGKISTASTVNFNLPATIPVNTYGNLAVMNGTNSFDAGTTTVAGNLVVGPNALLKGSPGNASQVVVGGNITQQATSALVAPDNRIDYRLTENVSHAILTATNFYAYSLTAGNNAVITVTPSGNPIRILLGSLNGGGLRLHAGSTLNVGASSVEVIGVGKVNEANETGAIHMTSGNFRITSGSATASNVYFHPAGNVVDSLTIDVSAAQVNMRSSVTIEGALIIKKGVLQGAGLVTLKASEIRTASLSEIGEGGNYAGNLRVQQYITFVQNQKVELASSVAGVTVANWQTYFPVTGSFAGSSGGTTDPSLFIFNGTSITPYPAPGGSNSAPIEKGRGYQARLSNVSPFVMETVGVPHQGSTAIPLIGNPSGAAEGGWSLVGNPFASSVIWSDTSSAFTKSGISNTIAVRENTVIDGQVVGRYKYFSSDIGEGTIPAGKAFWVRSISSSPSLTIHEKAKAAGSREFDVSGSVNYLKITLRQNAKEDDAYILFSANATDGYDAQLDASKKSNEGIFNLSTVVNGTSVAVNALSSNFCSTTVPVLITGARAGSYTFSFDGLSSLADMGQVSLTDAFTNTTVSLKTEYSFSITSDAASSAAGRFSLTFARSQLDLATPKATGQPACSASPALIQITNSQAGVEYSVLNSSQVVVSQPVLGNGGTIVLEVPVNHLAEGDNILAIRAGFPGCVSAALQSGATIHYTKDFVIQAQDDVSICLGEQGHITASGVPEGGSYRWYDDLGQVIPSQTSNSLQTARITGEISYQVSGVLANGCESDKRTIHVYADTLTVPVVTMYRDTLFAQVEGTFQWYRNGNLVQEATESFFVPKQTGNYTVVASSSGCSKESLPYSFVLDPGCVLDTSVSNVILTNNECGPEDYILSISNTLTGVVYSAINANDELISESITGTGQQLLLSIASSSLDSGMNHIRIRAEKESCINRTLDIELDINNIAPLLINVPDTVETCIATVATLTATSAEDITGYQWFNSAEERIDGQSGSVFTTQPISEPTIYFVSAQHNSGCSSVKEKIVVSPLAADAPVIVVTGGEMSVATDGTVQWFFEGQPIEGATSPAHVATKSGNYTVSVMQGNCERISAPYLFVVTSLDEVSSEFQLHAYPTPSTAKEFGVRVQSPETGSILVQLIDMTGRVVFKKWFEPHELASKTNLASDLKNGLYSVVVNQGNYEVRKRIVIKN